MYYDLCIEGPSIAPTRECLATLLTQGYSAAALCRHPAVEGRIGEADRCTSKAVPDALLATAGAQQAAIIALHQWDGLAPTAHPTPSHALLTESPSLPALRQLSRLTFTASEAVQCEALAAGAGITSGYDLLALQPTNERTLQQACASLDVEIITLNACERLPIKLRPATLRPALLRGVMFEVCYGPALHTSAARVMFISNTQALARCTRGRNIILSSGANCSDDIRSPHAASCLLASILDVPAGKACAALSQNAAAAVARGAARRARASLGLPVDRPVNGSAAASSGRQGKKVQAVVGLKPGQDVAKIPVVVSAGQAQQQQQQRPQQQQPQQQPQQLQQQQQQPQQQRPQQQQQPQQGQQQGGMDVAEPAMGRKRGR